jgi:hypothetical protein
MSKHYFFFFIAITQLFGVIDVHAQTALNVYWPDRPTIDFELPYTNWVNDSSTAQITLDIETNAENSHVLTAHGMHIKNQISFDKHRVRDQAYLKKQLEVLLLVFWSKDKEIRSNLSFELPQVSNQKEVDRWGLWAFSPQFNVRLYGDQSKDIFPPDDALLESNKVAFILGGFSAYRIGKIHRNTISLLADYQFRDINNIPENGPDFKNTNLFLTLRYNSMFRLGNHFMLGGAGRLTQHKDHLNFVGAPPTSSTTRYYGITASAEFNIFRYDDFFRRYWLFGIHAGMTKYRYLGSDYSSESTDSGIYSEAAQLTKWGYWSAYVACTTKSISTWRSINSGAIIGYNLGKSWYINIDLNYIRRNKKEGINPYMDFRASIGMAYYFGQGRANVINPRMRN